MTPAAQVIDYSVAIALEDFVPVALAFAGCVLLAIQCRRRSATLWAPALVGAIAVGTGGAAKAVWKLIRALDGPDLKWLAGALFPCLSLGFCLLAWALLHHERIERNDWVRGEPLGSPAVTVPLAVASGAALLGFAISAATSWSRAWVVPLIACVTLADLAVIVLCVRAGRLRQSWLIGAAFVVNFFGVLGLTRLSGVDRQTIALQWVEQTVNTLGSAAFLFGAWLLGRTAVRRS